MSRVLAHLAGLPPQQPVLESGDASVSALELREGISQWAGLLQDHGAQVVGLLADNGPAWVQADLAILASGAVNVPLPGFFSPAQLRHVVTSAGMDSLIAPQSLAGACGEDWRLLQPLAGGLGLYRRQAVAVDLPAGTAKITFTSGTTGQPKGVCLAQSLLERTAGALADLTANLDIKRHLSALPLSTLLENVAGVYAPLLAGARVVVHPLHSVGLAGSSGFDPARLLSALEASAADSLILVPEMLRQLVGSVHLQGSTPRLKFLAVGGGHVGARLISQARKAGLPVYEGYGLSECGSVVCLNRPGEDMPGAVGRPLSHARVEVSPRGEIVVSGASMLGYLGEPPLAQAQVLTGDLGRCDERGFIHVNGRRKNLLITAFGRNVSPEWVEGELCQGGAIAQALVAGDARPFLTALLVPAPGATEHDVSLQVLRTNAGLPDYARIGAWTLSPQPFLAANGLATPNGRPRRGQIMERHGPLMDQLYQSMLSGSAGH